VALFLKKFQRIYIEITNKCNLKCTFCPTVERETQILSPTQLSLILKKIEGHTEKICLHLMGEPLSHPSFDSLIGPISFFKIPVILTTNGMLLKNWIIPLSSWGELFQLNISIHSFPDNFLQNKPFSLEEKKQKFTHYLFTLVQHLDFLKENKPNLFVNFRLWNLSKELRWETSLKTEEELYNEMAIKFLENHYRTSIEEDRRIKKNKKNKRLSYRTFLHFDTRFVWPSLPIVSSSKYKVEPQEGTCQGLSSHIGIHSNGEVVPCCLDKEANLSLGNIFNQELSEILDSSRAKTIKEGFKKGYLREALCQNCDFATRFKTHLFKKP